MTKKKRNKKYIPQNKRRCPCGSGNEYENCCLAQNRNGPLIKKADVRFNDIHTIIIFEINTILGNLCIESKYLDKLYSGLIDIFMLSDDALKSCKDHVFNLKQGIGTQKNSNTYQVDDFDSKLNFYIRYFYISGGIVLDGLTRFAEEIGFNIRFLFGDEDSKKFEKKLNRLINKFENIENGKKFKDFILKQKKNWVGTFILNRNIVEHSNFKINQIEYLVNKNDKLLPQFPLIDGLTCNDLFRNYPINFFHFSRQIIIFLLQELAYKEDFMEGRHRGVIVPVEEEKMPFGELNKEKIIYKFTIQDKKTGEIWTVNFSRNCPKKRNVKK